MEPQREFLSFYLYDKILHCLNDILVIICFLLYMTLYD